MLTSLYFMIVMMLLLIFFVVVPSAQTKRACPSSRGSADESAVSDQVDGAQFHNAFAHGSPLCQEAVSSGVVGLASAGPGSDLSEGPVSRARWSQSRVPVVLPGPG